MPSDGISRHHRGMPFARPRESTRAAGLLRRGSLEYVTTIDDTEQKAAKAHLPGSQVQFGQIPDHRRNTHMRGFSQRISNTVDVH